MGGRLRFTLWTPRVWNCWKRISLGERRVLRLCRPAPSRRKIPGLTGVSRFWPEDRSRQATSVRLRALDDSPQMERAGDVHVSQLFDWDGDVCVLPLFSDAGGDPGRERGGCGGRNDGVAIGGVLHHGERGGEL